jgi:hypothetical protein
MKFASLPTCVVICLAGLAGAADARQVLVEGHYRPNGTWVPPHYRTVPDGTGYEGPAYGNPYAGAHPYTGVNPYAGAAAGNPYPYRAPYQSPYGSPYQAPYQAPYQGPYGTPVPPGTPAPYYGAP